MRIKKITIFIILILSVSTFSFAQSNTEIPVTKVKITDNVTLYKTGETGVFTNMIAVSTTKGVVVFDAHLLPSVAKKIRAMIENDFGKKIAYLINTHGAYDHTSGNMIFSDVAIIGHDNVKEDIYFLEKMAANSQKGQALLENLIKDKSSYKGIMKEYDENILSMKLILSEIQKNFSVAYPTIYFSDKMSLTVGNTTFQMFYNTPGYSKSDIVINIPEENVFILGDVFNKSRLPWFNEKTDFESWKRLFSNFISDNSKIKSFIGTHGYPMELNEVKEQFQFIDKLREEVTRLKKEGKTLDDVEKEIQLNKFPYLTNVNPLFYGTPINMLEWNIKVVYNQIK